MRISDWSSDVCSSDLLAELRKMKDDIASIDGGSSGLVCVGGLAYSRKTLLPEAIRRTLWAFPRIVVRTVEGPIGALIGAMPAGDIDALICARRSEEHTSELQSLMRISYADCSVKKT